ncbi:MAG: peptidylprolyl isomerase [Rikenellaceae bacterium]|nr:peptidylprolyl isomerase [Rikenellaceae bacterium]
MKMKKLLSIVICLLIAASAVVAQKRFVMLDKVVAVVGTSSVSYSDMQQYARQIIEQRRSEGYTSDRSAQNEALENLMMQKLLYNQALLDSVEISKGEVAQRVEQQVQAMIDREGSISAVEKKSHMAIYHIRDLFRRQIEEQSYAQMMQQTVVSKTKIVPGEVERFYNSLDKDSLPVIAEQYMYAQIVMFPKNMKEAKLRTRERLIEMRERIVTGKTRFATLARMYSVDGSAIQGGELEPAPLAGFVKPFADALAELKPGQVSEVVESEFGFHLIQLIDRKGQLYHCRHILLRPTFTMDEILAPMRDLDSLANLIKKDSLTFEEAAKKHSDDKHSKQNGGIVTNHDLLERYSAYDAKLTATKFLKEDFGAMGGKSIDDYNAIRRLKEGEMSAPFRSNDMMGNELVKIVKLLKVIPAHKASLDEDYLRLEQLALSQKQEREFKEWLDKKIAAMYIYIAPEFRSDEFENKNWVKYSK